MNELTASEITNEALRLLRTFGYTVWRQSNRGVKFRQHLTTPGIPDIIGFTNDGKFVACEVKKKGDRLSAEQNIFLTSLKIVGGVALVAVDVASTVIIKTYEPVQQKTAKVK